MDILLDPLTIWAAHMSRVDVTSNLIFGRYRIAWKDEGGLHGGTWRNTLWSAVRKAKRMQRKHDRAQRRRAKHPKVEKRWESS